jgi:hypothetical protein
MNPRTKHGIPLREGQTPPDGYIELQPYRATPPVYDKGKENVRRQRQIERGTLKPSTMPREMAKA